MAVLGAGLPEAVTEEAGDEEAGAEDEGEDAVEDAVGEAVSGDDGVPEPAGTLGSIGRDWVGMALCWMVTPGPSFSGGGAEAPWTRTYTPTPRAEKTTAQSATRRIVPKPM